MTATRFLLAAAVTAVIDVGIFGWIAWRLIDAQRTPSKEAQLALRAQRQAIGDTLPVFDLDAGRATRCKVAANSPRHSTCWSTTLMAAVLVRANVPFWFLKLNS